MSIQASAIGTCAKFETNATILDRSNARETHLSATARVQTRTYRHRRRRRFRLYGSQPVGVGRAHRYVRAGEAAGAVRPEAKLLLDTLSSLEDGQLQRCQMSAEQLLIQLGITFNVYGDSAGTERAFPFDLIPRIVRAQGAERPLSAELNNFQHDMLAGMSRPQALRQLARGSNG